MKLVLFALNGSYSHTNLAVRAIGAGCKASGFDTRIIERTLKDKRLSVLEALVREEADVYGFSVYIWNVTEMMALASALKTVLPHAAIVFGGPETSFEDESFFEVHPYVDYIIAGEGEGAFPALCRELSEGKTPKKLIMAEPYENFIEGGIAYDRIGEPPRGLIYYESVRGCPFSCAYCLSSVTDGIRAKTAETALSELLQFEGYDGIRTVKLVDRTFNFDKKRAATIWRGLCGENYTKEYHFEVSAALLDEELFEILENAPKGKFRLEIGVQSTNPETVAAVDRRLDTEKTLSALTRLHKNGNLHLHADLIAGLPYETYERFGKSFDDVYGRCDALQLGFLKLLKGSRMRREAGKYGILFAGYPPYEVLGTDALSFSEIARLHAIDDMNDRFSNSGKFAFTFPWLPMAAGSPFRFFEGLADFAEKQFACREIAKLPQAEAFRLLLCYAETLGVAAKETKERLALDFLLGETRKLPLFLRMDAISEEEKRALLMQIPPEKRSGCEVIRADFLSSAPIIVDRIGREILEI